MPQPGNQSPPQPTKPPLPSGYFDVEAQAPTAAKPPLPPGYHDVDEPQSPADLPGATTRLQETRATTQFDQPTQFEKDRPPETTAGAVWDTAKGIASGMYGMGKRALQMTTPGGAMAAQDDVIKNLAAEPQRNQERKDEGYGGLYRAVAPITDLLPVAPISASQMEEQAKHGQTKHIAAEAGAGAAMATAPYWTGPAMKGAAAVARPLAREAGEAADLMTPDWIKSRTQPEAGKAITQAVQPGANIPRFAESKEIAGPRIQQLKESGTLKNAAGEPVSEIKTPADLLDAVKAAKTHIWDKVENRLGPVDDYMADTTPIAAAMKASIPNRVREQYPQIAEGIEKRADTYLTPKPLRSLEEAIQSANNDLRDYYKRPMAGDSPITAQTGATEAEVGALRNLLDQKVTDLRGDGVTDLKREYGALRDMERAGARAKLVADRQKGVPLYEGLAALRAAGDLVSGNVLGAAKGGMTMAVGRFLQKLRNPEFLIDQAFQGKNAFKAAEPIADLAPHTPTPIQGAPLITALERQLPAAPEQPQLGEGSTILAGPAPEPPYQSPQGPPVLKRDFGPKSPPNVAGLVESLAPQPATGGTMTSTPEPPPPGPGQRLLPAAEPDAQGGPGKAVPLRRISAKEPQAGGTAKTAASPATAPAGPKDAKSFKPGMARESKLTVDGIKAMTATQADALRAIVDDANQPQKLRDAAYTRWNQVQSRSAVPAKVQETTGSG